MSLTSPEERDILKLRRLQYSLSSLNQALKENPEDLKLKVNKASVLVEITRIKSKYYYVVGKEETPSDV